MSQKSFMFRVEVKDPQKIEDTAHRALNNLGVYVRDNHFSNNDYAGHYEIKGNFIEITITKKPLWIFNYMIIEKCRQFIKKQEEEK